MKKWTSVLLASSLVFSTIGVTTITNDVSAKESTKVKTAASKDVAYSGMYFGDTKSEVKKKAKAKKWKLVDSDKDNLYYSQKVYGHPAIIVVSFKSNSLKDVWITFEDTDNLTSWSSIKAYHKGIYNKLNRDLKYKKSFTSDKNSNLATLWDLKKRAVLLSVGYGEAGLLFTQE